MANPNGGKARFTTLRARRNLVTVAGSTQTLDAKDSGSLVNIAVAATTITLPVAVAGLTFDFVSSVASTSSQKIITAVGTELLVGSVVGEDIDTGSVVVGWPAEAASSYIAVIMNGSTTGGLIGSRLTFTCLSATRWLVEGVNRGNGTVATLFSAS
jgi:hypothetical protein